ncbi:tRNA1(Val) (adenine(37)-N6)-methyltransferase [Proteiniclasticum sp. SCR006]|uniref:tRNA1(Val) (Adenine(37)-N6)-methyltransferase n=1 Tax=Proteiniclasticum aestuarii TaxID=2817862 RepID=A0A939HER3_9CLOT|nr:tRNA1(Val) (adenine(37)-N6)-methyltransferase [Proteiniclasticum aestuarii]MBO1265958.1 tRNA1(Val) (adenine(37)-N6)-methyltransferase [Proteiniclasticum aestuarii]
MSELLPGETLEDLERDGLKIIQKEKGFRFGVDAVLLSDFARVKKKDLVMDFCTGTGILPILLYGKSHARQITGIELQDEFAEMAMRSVQLNHIEDRVKILKGDVRDETLLKSLPRFDVVTVNPPYKKENSGIINEKDALTIARHEVTLNLEDVIRGARTVLRDQGRFYMIHRPERLADILTLMRKYRIEPKRMRMVYPNTKKAPTMVLVEGVRDGGAFLKVEAPLYVYNEDGTYSDEIRRIYGDDRR